MRKLLVASFGVVLLGLGMGFAQTDADVTEEGVTVEIEAQEGVEFDTNNFVGIMGPVPFGLLYGIENVQLFGAEPDLRFRTSGNFVTGRLTLGVDALFDITQLEENIQLYGGPSLDLGTVIPLVPSFGLSGFVGGEYRFNRELGFFAEIGSGISFPIGFDVRGAAGINYHF